ncbi:MAG TPA: hypothetical protein VGV61_05375, partial [Thermoanaerobaculia bacterium]|nr:hypothetical protein [Thermoanaerobaculia bacterium]
VARQAQATVNVPWQPTAAGKTQVTAKVYDETNSEVASASAGQVTVAPPSGGGKPPHLSTTPQVSAIGPASKFKGLLGATTATDASKLSYNMARPGFPLIGALSQTKTMSADGVSLPIANDSSSAIKELSATLQVDGKAAGQQKVGTLLPGQSRTVVFALHATPGKPHDVKVVLARPGATPLVAGLLHLDAASTRTGVRGVPGMTSGAHGPAVRPAADAATAAATPGAVALSASMPGSRFGATGSSGRQTGSTTTGRTGTTGPSIPGTRGQQGPRPRPDLALGGGAVRVSPQSGPPGRPVSVQVVVTNVGAGASGGASVSFQVVGSRGVAARGSQRLGAVAPGGRAMAGWSFNMPPAGSWRVQVAVQASDDGNPGNNVATAGVSSVAPRIQVQPRTPIVKPTMRQKPPPSSR